ncbi:hypothetical protein [Enterobacter cloacae]|uniref:hypothetical protein n=1 Tax=Enterobacter cloacae TaxID=550 RepID=UPI003D9CBE1E
MIFTKEQLIGIIESADDVLQALAGTHDDIHQDSDKMCEAWNYLNDNAAPPAVVKRLAEIALASLEAEAVGEVVLGEYDDCGCHPDARVVCIAANGQADWENFKDGTRLYTAPPAPIVPDIQHSERLDWTLGQWASHLGGRHQNNDPTCYYEFGSFMAVAEMLRQFGNVQQKVGWNACRAAMLQAGNHTEQYLDMVDHSGDATEKVIMLQGAENAESRCTIQTAPVLDSLPKIAESRCSNSPVIPDEVLSAVRKVARIRADFDDFDGDRRGIVNCLDEAEQELIVTINKHASRIAAPQQEVK